MNTKEKIACMLENMPFDRRPPVSKLKKAQFAALEAGVSALVNDLNKLRLRLSHATSQPDYHSLSLEEARLVLNDAKDRLDALTESPGTSQ